MKCAWRKNGFDVNGQRDPVTVAATTRNGVGPVTFGTRGPGFPISAFFSSPRSSNVDAVLARLASFDLKTGPARDCNFLEMICPFANTARPIFEELRNHALENRCCDCTTTSIRPVRRYNLPKTSFISGKSGGQTAKSRFRAAWN